MDYTDHVLTEWVPCRSGGFEYQARVREQNRSFTCCLDSRSKIDGKFSGIKAGSIKDTLEEARKTVLEWFVEVTAAG